MTKIEFLNELSSRIVSLPKNEIDKSLSYYDEIINDRIEDGMLEEDAIDALGSMDEIAENIMLDMSIPTLMKAKIYESKNKSSNKTLWTILAIVGSPIWVPLLLAFGLILLSFYIVIWSLIISLYAIVVSLGLTGVLSILGGIMICVIKSFPVGICIIGAAFVCVALTLFMIKPMVSITKSLVNFTVSIAQKIKSGFITTGGMKHENS